MPVFVLVRYGKSQRPSPGRIVISVVRFIRMIFSSGVRFIPTIFNIVFYRAQPVSKNTIRSSVTGHRRAPSGR
jgi:hypothetical protein